MKSLSDLRVKIDELDEKIQELLATRADIALKVAAAKKAAGDAAVFYTPEREKEILEQVIKRNHSALKNADLIKIFQQIMTSCLAIQQPLQIAFLGPLGTFSHEAAAKCFGESVTLVPQSSIKDVVLSVEQGVANYGLVPIENSTEGVVGTTLDCLRTTSLTICNEIVIPIHHYLVTRCQHLTDITQVYSHPQPLAQCQQWLEKNLPNAALLPAKSSAQAAMLAAREANTAAIAGELILEQHNLNVLAKYIEDIPNNATRFYVLGKQAAQPTGKDRTSLLVQTTHQPGALAGLLNLFAVHDINLTLIESRPDKQQEWRYIFFLEMEGHQQDKKLALALQELIKNQAGVKILGSFPRGIL